MPAAVQKSKKQKSSKNSSRRPRKLSLRRELSKIFKLDDFRESQKQIIETVLAGEDVLAILPTGAGKSLCYQLPAIELEGLTLVVSRLISLMRDQNEKLKALSIEAAVFNSAQKAEDLKRGEALLREHHAKIVFVTPERLAQPAFLKKMSRQKISLLVVDEAHCISEWGHDFRPSYQRVGAIRKKMGDPPILALTATATEPVTKEIEKLLGMKKPKIFRAGIFRKNLRFAAQFLEGVDEKMTALRGLLATSKTKPVLIYVSSIKTGKELQMHLRANGFDPLLYHGQMKRVGRTENQDRFMTGESNLMIATSAFGMGVDKANIRHVIHYQVPGSLESYYQEAGRAGRDGKRSDCTLLYLKKDLNIHRFFLGAKYPRSDEIIQVADFIRQEGDATLERLAQGLQISRPRLTAILAAFAAENIRSSSLKNTSEQIDGLLKQSNLREVQDKERIKQLVLYAETALCRWHQLRKYFGEMDAPTRCRSCDNCIKFGAHEFDNSLID